MKLVDLNTGEVVMLPPQMVPGRYRLLEPATLNGTLALNIGDVLWSDGGTRCDLQDIQGTPFRSTFVPISADQAGTWELVDQGVLTVAKQVNEAPCELPAPLMPNSLTRFANPSAFEISLDRVLGAGHLNEISAHPRMSMRYDATLLPVSRARRLASGALERLASRSEDWRRRTLAGVEPAHVLAEVSEDEWATYENIVFARLVDQANRLISRHERDVALLIERQESALKLSQAEDLNYRLREKLCLLWGQANTQPQEADDPLQTRLKELSKLGKRLRQLRFGRLYQAIPRSSRVPIALKNTNVLTHDRHYREMREVWQLAHQGELGDQAKPEEKIRQRMTQHAHYDMFVGLLTRHALNECQTLKTSGKSDEWQFAGAKLILQKHHPCEWQLRLEWPGKAPHEATTMTFVAAWEGHSNWQESVECAYALHERQPVYCHPTHAEGGVTETGEDGVLNPLQFYAVERMKQRIESWLYWQVFESYPVQITTMQTLLRDDLCNKASQAFVPQHKGLRIVGAAKNFDAVGLARSQGANAVTLEKLTWGLAIVATLETCRVCGKTTAALKIDSQKSTFWTSCNCGYEWGLKYQSGDRKMVFRFNTQTDSDAASDFRRNGAWVL